ncbi:MAG TPA: hypothetical protein VGI16_10725 [Candidatus Acidoferrum sp.]|jgi:hypothetical protein
MKKTLYVLLILVPSFCAQSTKPFPPPQAVCTTGVKAEECEELTNYLSVVQQASTPTRSVQFVIADNASYEAAKQRAIAMMSNRIDRAPQNSVESTRAMASPNTLFSWNAFYELDPTTRLISKVYFNESKCHGDKIKTDAYDSQSCDMFLFYTLGFVEGAFSGSINTRSDLTAGRQ